MSGELGRQKFRQPYFTFHRVVTRCRILLTYIRLPIWLPLFYSVQQFHVQTDTLSEKMWRHHIAIRGHTFKNHYSLGKFSLHYTKYYLDYMKAICYSTCCDSDKKCSHRKRTRLFVVQQNVSVCLEVSSPLSNESSDNILILMAGTNQHDKNFFI